MPIQREESFALEVIRSSGMLHTFPPNIELFRQGQLIQGVFLLEQGKVKMTRTEYCGNDMITEINEPGQLLGATSVLSQSPAVATATTLTTCCI